MYDCNADLVEHLAIYGHKSLTSEQLRRLAVFLVSIFIIAFVVAVILDQLIFAGAFSLIVAIFAELWRESIKEKGKAEKAIQKIIAENKHRLKSVIGVVYTGNNAEVHLLERELPYKTAKKDAKVLIHALCVAGVTFQTTKAS